MIRAIELSQLFYLFTYYSIQNFPQNAPIIPKDCPIIPIKNNKKSMHKNMRVQQLCCKTIEVSASNAEVVLRVLELELLDAS